MSLRETEARLHRMQGAYDALVNQRARAAEELGKAQGNAEELTIAAAILHGLEDKARTQFQHSLSAIVSHAVTAVFGESIDIRLVATTARDQATLTFEVEQDGLVTDIMSAKGGSLVQVVAFALRVLLVLNDPGLANVLILDEPFSMVSEEYRPRVAELIRELSAKLGTQFIIVTHEPEMIDAADVAYEVKRDGDCATLITLKTAEEVA